MKIAMPVENNSIEASVCPSFGRTPYFLVYDLDTNRSSFIDNSAAASSGGAGIKAAQLIVDSKVDALLTPRCGQNAADVLNEASVSIYKITSMSIKENIDNFVDGKLDLLEEIHAGFHGHGGN